MWWNGNISFFCSYTLMCSLNVLYWSHVTTDIKKRRRKEKTNHIRVAKHRSILAPIFLGIACELSLGELSSSGDRATGQPQLCPQRTS